MNYVICIPSYKRQELCKNNTLATLKKHNICPTKINVYVANQDEYKIYKQTLDSTTYANLIVGYIGLVEQKRFIESQYEEGVCIMYMDDDIKDVIWLDTNITSLDNLIRIGFEICKKEGAYLWSVYPVCNPFYMKNNISTSLKLCIGGFSGIINRPSLEDIRITLTTDREDVERTLRYYIKDHKVIRFNNIGFKTKFFNKGGHGLLEERIDTIHKDVKKLDENFVGYGKIKQKKNCPDFALNYRHKFVPLTR
jgi:hypothetical protein